MQDNPSKQFNLNQTRKIDTSKRWEGALSAGICPDLYHDLEREQLLLSGKRRLEQLRGLPH